MNTYVFDSSTQKKLFITFGIGILLLLLGILFSGGSNTTEEHHGAAKHEQVEKTTASETVAPTEAEGHGHEPHQ